MASLKIENADKKYLSGSLALYNVNLEADNGEFLVILGGEGSGKSTLIRVISGLEDLTGGDILIDGKSVKDEDVKSRDVAAVFKNGAIKQNSNVFDNLAYGLVQRKVPSSVIEYRVKAVAEILGLGDVLYRLPKALTAAQKQRVAIGRTIVREPRLYLFDEPLSGLDEKLKGELLNLIINLQARMEGTFVYATKNVSEALGIGTRIAVLKDGFVQQIDTPSNLYDYPENAYVAFYIGSPTINFIHDAEIVKADKKYSVRFGETEIPLAENIVVRFKGIDEYADTHKKVILGVRPEDAALSAEGIAAEVKKFENGYAECSVGGNTFVVKEGKGTKISLDEARIYLFDEATHLTLLGRDGGYNKTKFADAEFKPLTLAEESEIKSKNKPQKSVKRK